MSAVQQKTHDERIDWILAMITELATGNLDARTAPSETGDELDGIMVGMNMLAEEFEANIGELQQTHTDLEERTEELSANSQLLESVLENMSDGVVVTDYRGEIILFNAVARRIFGTRQRGEQPERLSDIEGILRSDGSAPIPTDELPSSRALLGEARDHVEMQVRNEAHPEGVYVDTASRPFRDEEGRITGSIGVFRDISSKKLADIELKKTNQRLNELLAKEERHASEFRLLADMSSILQATESMDELYMVTTDFLERLFPEESGALYIYHESRDILEKRAAWGDFPDEEMIMSPVDCWGLRRGRNHVVFGEATHLTCSHARSLPDQCYVCVPIMGPDNIIGLLHIRHERLKEADTKQEEQQAQECERFATTAAEYIGLAIVNLQLRLVLRQQPIRDPLTGLFNRRFLEESLTREILRSERNNKTFCTLMLDIDHFKVFNDTNSHAAGDAVLRKLGTLLQDNSRGGDIVSRYGGEEIALMFPEVEAEDGRNRAEEIRKKISNMHVVYNDRDLGSVTVSIGVSIYPDDGDTTETLLHSADKALYEAKNAGRNRVEVYNRQRMK